MKIDLINQAIKIFKEAIKKIRSTKESEWLDNVWKPIIDDVLNIDVVLAAKAGEAAVDKKKKEISALAYGYEEKNKTILAAENEVKSLKLSSLSESDNETVTLFYTHKATLCRVYLDKIAVFFEKKKKMKMKQKGHLFLYNYVNEEYFEVYQSILENTLAVLKKELSIKDKKNKAILQGLIQKAIDGNNNNAAEIPELLSREERANDANTNIRKLERVSDKDIQIMLDKTKALRIVSDSKEVKNEANSQAEIETMIRHELAQSEGDMSENELREEVTKKFAKLKADNKIKERLLQLDNEIDSKVKKLEEMENDPRIDRGASYPTKAKGMYQTTIKERLMPLLSIRAENEDKNGKLKIEDVASYHNPKNEIDGKLNEVIIGKELMVKFLDKEINLLRERLDLSDLQIQFDRKRAVRGSQASKAKSPKGRSPKGRSPRIPVPAPARPPVAAAAFFASGASPLLGVAITPPSRAADAIQPGPAIAASRADFSPQVANGSQTPKKKRPRKKISYDVTERLVALFEGESASLTSAAEPITITPQKMTKVASHFLALEVKKLDENDPNFFVLAFYYIELAHLFLTLGDQRDHRDANCYMAGRLFHYYEDIGRNAKIRKNLASYMSNNNGENNRREVENNVFRLHQIDAASERQSAMLMHAPSGAVAVTVSAASAVAANRTPVPQHLARPYPAATASAAAAYQTPVPQHLARPYPAATASAAAAYQAPVPQHLARPYPVATASAAAAYPYSPNDGSGGSASGDTGAGTMPEEEFASQTFESRSSMAASIATSAFSEVARGGGGGSSAGLIHPAAAAAAYAPASDSFFRPRAAAMSAIPRATTAAAATGADGAYAAGGNANRASLFAVSPLPNGISDEDLFGDDFEFSL